MAFELLEGLSSRQIQELYEDINYISQGYKILTVVDTFDICEYCFPLGIEMDEKRKKSMGQMGDEQFAYDFLFSRHIGGKPLLVNEYKLELFNIRNKILRMSESLLNRRNNLEEAFIRPILDEADPKKRKAMLLELQNTLSFLISYALFSEESVSRFSRLVRTNFISDAAEMADDLVSEMFTVNDPDFLALVKATFEEWVDSRRPALQKITDKADLVNELNAAYRDITALIRVLTTNKKAFASGAQCLVLLHSSTRDRTDSILKVKKICELQASIGMPENSFIRNKSQTFLLSLLLEQGAQKDDDRLQKLADRLSDLVKVAKDYETWQSINESYADNVKPVHFIRASDQIIDNARFAFEQNYLLARMDDYKAYKQKIETLVRKLENENGSQYGEIIDLYNDFLGQAKRKVFGNNTELAFENVKLVYSLQLSISAIIKSIIQARKIRVSKGADMIRGTFHHLPFLMFLGDSNFDRNAKKIMDPLLDFCLKPESVRDLQTGDFIQVLQGFTDFEARFKETPTISLLSLFLMLLLPVVDEKKQSNDFRVNEERALVNAENLYPIYEQFKNILDKNSINYFKELRYIMVWLYRRCQRYDDSGKMAESAMTDYPDDPRFYHGKCLALYSKYFAEEKAGNAGTAEIDQMIIPAKAALLLYEKDKDTNEKVLYSMVALYNTLAHLYSIKYSLDNEPSSLLHARENFNLVQKSLDGDVTYGYKEYPELLHTEASVELNEALAYKKAEEWTVAIMKVESAKESIRAALHMVPGYEFYLKLEARINSEAREIRRMAVKEEKKSLRG